jgi:hypothetical protein
MRWLLGAAPAGAATVPASEAVITAVAMIATAHFFATVTFGFSPPRAGIGIPTAKLHNQL